MTQISEFVKKIHSGEIDVVEHTNKVLQQTTKLNKEFHHLNEISTTLAKATAHKLKESPKGKLAGLPISAKDAILVQDVQTRAGSKILTNYNPLFNATVINKLQAEGAIIIGKTAQDAFGFGSFSTNVGLDLPTPLNPNDKERACGGSSGGSAGFTKAATFPHASLGESTGGSIVNPASFCGVYGLCPTYGRVSRYGLMAYANSLDKIGPMATSPEDLALILEIIAGHDKLESTSLKAPIPNYTKEINPDTKLKVGIISETVAEGTDPKITDQINSIASKLNATKVSLPLTHKHGVPAYFLLAMAEASTNLAKYCGMRYGQSEKLEGSFNEYFTKVRSNNFNQETKRRIIIGTFARMAGYRDAYYLKATKVRTKIIEEYKKLYKTYDILISPTMPIVAPTFKEIEKLTPLQNYMMDTMTVGPNIAGLPHLNIPSGTKDNLPVGLLATADHLEEAKLLQLAHQLK